MTIKDFVTEIEAYYGKYPNGQRKYVALYLRTMSEKQLDALFDHTIKTYSSQYGKVPDIAVFEGLLADVKRDIRIMQNKEIEKAMSACEDSSARLPAPGDVVFAGPGEIQALIDRVRKKMSQT